MITVSIVVVTLHVFSRGIACGPMASQEGSGNRGCAPGKTYNAQNLTAAAEIWRKDVTMQTEGAAISKNEQWNKFQAYWSSGVTDQVKIVLAKGHRLLYELTDATTKMVVAVAVSALS